MPPEPSPSLSTPSPELHRLLVRLRTTVAGHVAARRAAGATLECVLPEMRRLVDEAMAREGAHDPSDALSALVVRWSIDAYCDQPELQHVPRFY